MRELRSFTTLMLGARVVLFVLLTFLGVVFGLNPNERIFFGPIYLALAVAVVVAPLPRVAAAGAQADDKS